MLAFHVRRTWAFAAALMLILLIELSRIYLNAHFPLDVVAGWVFGALCPVVGVYWGLADAANDEV